MTACDEAALARQAAAHFRATFDNTPWDGPAAMSECSHSDTPATCFKSICAAEKNNDAPSDTQDHWALPHHKHAGGPANKAGVVAALGRVDSTDGIDAASARAHLEKHAAAWGGGGQNSQNLHAAAEYRQASLGRAHRRDHAKAGDPDSKLARLQEFPAQFRHSPEIVDGKEMRRLDGYASVTGLEYEMFDMFGVYYESVNPAAFDKTLAANPDVAFLLNHKGVTMARTRNESLALTADPRGLHASALVNPKRTDIADMLIAIDDLLLTEMSFAFMIEDWEWDEDFMHLELLQVDIDRGDVSVVNFGANPYTSIEARAQDFLKHLGEFPEHLQRAAFSRLGQTLGVPVITTDRLASQAARAQGRSVDVAERALTGRAVDLVERLAELDGC